MAVETFPQLAINLIYTILCLVPGFVTMKTAGYVGEAEFELDQFDKGTWSLIGSGISLSVLYFVYVGWMAMVTGRFRLVVPVDLQWTELVAIYPVLLGVAVGVGYVTGRLLIRVRGSSNTSIDDASREGTTE